MICKNCGCEVDDGMKFCGECGTPIPQTKKCINCGCELPLNMKFCGECGTKQDGTASKSSGFSMGDKNVIAGDVIGSKEETNISGNATIIKNEDQTKQVKECHVCGSFVQILEGYNCSQCGGFTCAECFDQTYRVCNPCVDVKIMQNENKYKEALEKALQDGIINIEERKELKELQAEYGITDEKAFFLEKELKSKIQTVKINFSTIEKLKLEEATELFYEEGNVFKAYELLEPIYKAHPYAEEVLNIYLPILIKKDIEGVQKIINESNVDLLPLYLAEIEIALKEKNLDQAERKINQGKQLWQSNMLKYYEAILYIELVKITKKESFIEDAEKILNSFTDIKDKLEASYKTRLFIEISKIKKEDIGGFTEEFCKENNVYTNIVIPKLRVGKEISSIGEALDLIEDNGTIILEPGIYKEHINFNKRVKIIGSTTSIMDKSVSELPIIALDSKQICKISADVEIEGVVFTHEENLSFNNLKDYANKEYNFDENKEFIEYGKEGYTAIEVASNSILKNVALLDTQSRGITFIKNSGKLENSLISHNYSVNLFCTETSSPQVTNCEVYNGAGNGLNIVGTSTPKFINCKIHDNNSGALVWVKENANPYLESCEVYNGAGNSIAVEGQASGTYEGCHIHDIGDNNGLYISGTSTPKFINCKIHDNTKYALVYVGENANPYLESCEVYNGAGSSIAVEGQASGTYEGCDIHDIGDNNGLNIAGTSTPKFINCRIHDNNSRALVWVKENANPYLESCEVYNGAGSSIAVEGQASGTYEGCDIHDIGDNNGLNIAGTSTPKFINCKIHDNTDYALVSVRENANPYLESCEVYNGAGISIAVAGQASGTFEGCDIHDIGDNNGLYISGTSTPKFINCKIHDNNSGALVYVGENANPYLESCEVYNGIYGIGVEGQASGTFEGCDIHDIGDNNGLYISGTSTPKFINCRIHDNTNYALVAVCENANPYLGSCEVYNGASMGIYLCDKAMGTYINCYAHDNVGKGFCNETKKSIKTPGCNFNK